jgi:hypothetical protein
MAKNKKQESLININNTLGGLQPGPHPLSKVNKILGGLIGGANTTNSTTKPTLQEEWDAKDPETRRCYTYAWYIYIDLKEVYEAFEGGKLKISEWRDAVKKQVEKGSGFWEVGERTLNDVKRFGEGGIIPKE